MTNIGRVNAAIYRNMQLLISSRLSNLKIKNGQYDFFLIISLREGISQKELSDELHIGKSTTAKAVKSLINNGYVRKEKDKHDGRIEHLYLTELGQKEAPLVQQIFNENMKAASKGFTESEVIQLLSLMDRVLENIVDENKNILDKAGDKFE